MYANARLLLEQAKAAQRRRRDDALEGARQRKKEERAQERAAKSAAKAAAKEAHKAAKAAERAGQGLQTASQRRKRQNGGNTDEKARGSGAAVPLLAAVSSGSESSDGFACDSDSSGPAATQTQPLQIESTNDSQVDFSEPRHESTSIATSVGRMDKRAVADLVLVLDSDDDASVDASVCGITERDGRSGSMQRTPYRDDEGDRWFDDGIDGCTGIMVDWDELPLCRSFLPGEFSPGRDGAVCTSVPADTAYDAIPCPSPLPMTAAEYHAVQSKGKRRVSLTILRRRSSGTSSGACAGVIEIDSESEPSSGCQSDCDSADEHSLGDYTSSLRAHIRNPPAACNTRKRRRQMNDLHPVSADPILGLTQPVLLQCPHCKSSFDIVALADSFIAQSGGSIAQSVVPPPIGHCLHPSCRKPLRWTELIRNAASDNAVPSSSIPDPTCKLSGIPSKYE
jgi:hypothetical protein